MLLVGVSLSKLHTSMVYGTTCIDRPANRVRPIHVIPIRCMYPRCHATMPHSYHVNSAVCSRDSYKTENADDGKAKSRDTRATNCEAGTRERPANLFILALPCRSRHASLGFTFFSLVTSHKPFFTLSYISTTCAHCFLDKTSRTRNAYRRP